MRRRVGVEDKSRFSIHDISLGEDLGHICELARCILRVDTTFLSLPTTIYIHMVYNPFRL